MNFKEEAQLKREARLDRIEEKIDKLTNAIDALTHGDGIPSREGPLPARDGGEGWIYKIGIGLDNLYF